MHLESESDPPRRATVNPTAQGNAGKRRSVHIVTLM